MPQDVTQLPQDVTQLPQEVTQLPQAVTQYKLLCPEAGALPGDSIFGPPLVENTSFCVRKQAPLPGESILQAFSCLSVLPQGPCFMK